MSDITLDQVVEMALQLSKTEQQELVQRVSASMGKEYDPDYLPTPEELAEGNWTEEEIDAFFTSRPKTGAEIVAMLESGEIDTSFADQMINPHITDAVEWVKALREEMNKGRDLNWGKE
jgi:uncharacterized protein (DUF305 family)